MHRILLKTTTPFTEDDWNVGRFSLLQRHLRSLVGAGGGALYEVVARDRVENGAGDDMDLTGVDAYDQLWLVGTDPAGALTKGDIDAIARFRRSGGGLLLTRDHQDLGSCLCKIPIIGMAEHFQRVNPESDAARRRIDDTETTSITWPNYHSGRNGDAQRITPVEPLHPLIQRATGGPLEWLPAHPHEGVVSAPTALGGSARVVARGCSATTGTTFNLVVAIEGGESTGGGRVIADSSFHHFCDCNWDPSAGAPSFVSEPWGDGMKRSLDAQTDVRRYVENIAAWLAASRA